MAGTVRNGRVTAQVRYKGVSIAQTFDTRTAATRWSGAVKAAIDNREWPRRDLIPPHLWRKWGLEEAATAAVDDTQPHPGWTLDRALAHYDRTVSGRKKGWKQEHNRIEWWRRRELTKKRLDEVTSRDLQGHVGERLAAGRSANTVRNEIFLLSAVYQHASAPDADGTGQHGWGLTSLVNPVPDVILPPPPDARHRRLEDGDDVAAGEEERLLAALANGPDGTAMVVLFVLSIETGMRLSEVLDVRRGQLLRTRGVRSIRRPDSKNNAGRRVVLSTRAAAALDDLVGQLPADADPDARIFKLDVPAVEYRWRLARKAAGVKGLRWHDLRHEGLSRMAEKGLTIGELKAQSGHRTAQVLLGYVNARASEVARKLG